MLCRYINRYSISHLKLIKMKHLPAVCVKNSSPSSGQHQELNVAIDELIKPWRHLGATGNVSWKERRSCSSALTNNLGEASHPQPKRGDPTLVHDGGCALKNSTKYRAKNEERNRLAGCCNLIGFIAERFGDNNKHALS